MRRPPVRNRDGAPIDPVPFIVAVLTAFLITHTWGPQYLGALGVSVRTSLLIVTALFIVIAAVAYHQFVWAANPDRANELPAGVRFDRLRYAVFVGIALLVLLLLPFVGWSAS